MVVVWVVVVTDAVVSVVVLLIVEEVSSPRQHQSVFLHCSSVAMASSHCPAPEQYRPESQVIEVLLVQLQY